jgi:hypothetical protein
MKYKFLKNSKKYLLLVAFVVAVYFSIIVSLYLFAMNTQLPGRRGGPQDAFRHTFSSALVARYISPYAVELVTLALERDNFSDMDLMDRHNNRVGIGIGLSNDPIYETVLKKIEQGQINAKDRDQITWLRKSRWSGGL